MWLWVSFTVSLGLWGVLGFAVWWVLTIIIRSPLAAQLAAALMAGMTPIALLVLFRLSLAVFDSQACACKPSLWPRLFARTLRTMARHPIASTKRHLVSSRRRARGA